MGIGDVKLAGLIGLVLGSIGLGLVGVAAGAGIVFGGVGAIVALVAGGNRKTRVPYGPFMAAGALLSVFVGQQIADAYVCLLGAEAGPNSRPTVPGLPRGRSPHDPGHGPAPPPVAGVTFDD